jgi:hypothetical protein
MTFQEILETRPNASKARLPALYADFRPLKHNNPDGYEANVQVWQSALSTAVKGGVLSNNDNNLVLDVTSQLLSVVSVPPWGRPLGLGSVVVLKLSWRVSLMVVRGSVASGVDSPGEVSQRECEYLRRILVCDRGYWMDMEEADRVQLKWRRRSFTRWTVCLAK